MKILETNSQEHIAREREREKRERYGGGTRAPKRVHTFKSNRGEGAEKRAGVLFVFIERGIFFKKKTTDVTTQKTIKINRSASHTRLIPRRLPFRGTYFKEVMRLRRVSNLLASSSSSSSSLVTTSIFSRPMSAPTRFASSSPTPKGFYELRRYKILPSKRAEYIELCDEFGALRKKLTPGFCGFYVPEVGSDLNTVTHIYHYDDYDHRDKVRLDMKGNERWQSFLRKTLGLVEEQTSEVYIEATVATNSAGLSVNSFKENASKRSKTGDYNDSNSIFEIRTYTLQLGYNPIPKMQNLYAEGLPSKIASDEEKLSELIWIGYADVGDLNKFVEIWKYPSYQSHIKVREAARTANAWRDTIGKIAPMVTHFNTTLCSAAPFSPVR